MTKSSSGQPEESSNVVPVGVDNSFLTCGADLAKLQTWANLRVEVTRMRQKIDQAATREAVLHIQVMADATPRNQMAYHSARNSLTILEGEALRVGRLEAEACRAFFDDAAGIDPDDHADNRAREDFSVIRLLQIGARS